jgi:predicted nucleic acid-binding protein
VAIVVDNSVSMTWCFEDEASPYGEAVLGLVASDEARVPALWPLEVANAIVVAERRRRITREEALRIPRIFDELPIHIDALPLEIALGPVIALARTYDLTAYDAAYLELAQRHGLPLATQDGRLLAAAPQAGVAIFRP